MSNLKLTYAQWKNAVTALRLAAMNFEIFNCCPQPEDFGQVSRLLMAEVTYPDGITWKTDPLLRELSETRTMLSTQRNKYIREHGGKDAVRQTTV